MGLFSDITDFVNEFSSIGDEVRTTIQDTADTFVQGKDEVVQTISDTRDEIANTTTDMKDSLRGSTDIQSGALDDK